MSSTAATMSDFSSFWGDMKPRARLSSLFRLSAIAVGARDAVARLVSPFTSSRKSRSSVSQKTVAAETVTPTSSVSFSSHWSNPAVRKRTEELSRLFDLYGAAPVVQAKPQTPVEKSFSATAAETTRETKKKKGIFHSFMTRVAVPASLLLLGAAVLLPVHQRSIAVDTIVTKRVPIVSSVSVVSKPMPFREVAPIQVASTPVLLQEKAPPQVAAAPVSQAQEKVKPVVVAKADPKPTPKAQVKAEFRKPTPKVRVPEAIAQIVTPEGFRLLPKDMQKKAASLAEMDDVDAARFVKRASSIIFQHDPDSKDVARLTQHGFRLVAKNDAFGTLLGRELAADMAYMYMGHCGAKKNLEKAGLCAFLSADKPYSGTILKGISKEKPELFAVLQKKYELVAKSYVTDEQLAQFAAQAKIAEKFLADVKVYQARRQEEERLAKQRQLEKEKQSLAEQQKADAQEEGPDKPQQQGKGKQFKQEVASLN